MVKKIFKVAKGDSINADDDLKYYLSLSTKKRWEMHLEHSIFQYQIKKKYDKNHQTAAIVKRK
jgi:hypothetical protein